MKQKLVAVKIYKAVDHATCEVSLFGVTDKNVVVVNWCDSFNNPIKRRTAVENLLMCGCALTAKQVKRMSNPALLDDYHALLMVNE